MEAKPLSGSSLRYMPMVGSERLTRITWIALALAVLFAIAAGAHYLLRERGQRPPVSGITPVSTAPSAFEPPFHWPAAAILTAACFVEPVLRDLSGLSNSAPIKGRLSPVPESSASESPSPPSPTQSCTGTFNATVPQLAASLQPLTDQGPDVPSAQAPVATQSPPPAPSPQPKFAVGLPPTTEQMRPNMPAPAAAAPPQPEPRPAPVAPPKPSRNIPVANPPLLSVDTVKF
jgi:hypothetical protein